MLRSGLSRLDVLIVLVVIALLASVSFPAILAGREAARRAHCAHNLRILGIAIHQYHDTHQFLPPAVVWHAGTLRSLMLNQSRRIDLITHENWAQLLLPHLGRNDVAQMFDWRHPIGADENQAARMTSLTEMTCPSDSFNRRDNCYLFELNPDALPHVEFARGNYAINGGTQCHRTQPGTPARPCGDGVELTVDEEHRLFQQTGSGIAAINRAFSLADCVNGQSTLVALEEVRAGIHPLDSRGVWSLGQIGGSITFAHGVSGDAGGPNNLWDRADDVLGCGRLHAAVGAETLANERMPCAPYIDRNDQATARSLHPHGVNVLFLDGTIRFVSDRVDRGLWHVMHSRETPADILADHFDDRLGSYEPSPDRQPVSAPPSGIVLEPGTLFKNSLNMSFVVLPPGEFQMGIPDIGNGVVPPPECPIHPVRITRGLWLGKHEVTQQAFEAVIGRNPSYHRSPDGESQDTSQFPVEQVSWDDATEFCRQLSELPEERAAKRRYRLPTEAEWEYACRAGKSKPYEWKLMSEKRQDSGENAGIDPPLPITKVGSYRPNEFGLHDMRGNVWEWCSDWFDRTYYSRSPVEDPQGPNEGYVKVLRGSDWIFVGEVCRINYPIMAPWKSNQNVGFRVVCEPVP